MVPSLTYTTRKKHSRHTKKSTELDPDNKAGWNQLWHLYQRIGEIEKVENVYITILKKLAGSDREYQAIAYGNLGLVYKTRGDLDKAIKAWQKSLILFTEIGAAAQMSLVQAWLDAVTPHKVSP